MLEPATGRARRGHAETRVGRARAKRRAGGARARRGARRWTRPLVAALALSALGACKPLDDAMVAVFGRSMRDQRSFDPYENTRPAPENSVAFSAGNWNADPDGWNVGQPEGVDIPHFTFQTLGPVGVGSEAVQRLGENPIPFDSDQDMARGEEIYLRFCVVCHGPDGVGANAYITADRHPMLPLYNLSGEQVASYTDQYIYGMIRVGRGLMPAYGPRITHYDRWRVVNYVRKLQLDMGNTPISMADGSAAAGGAGAAGPDGGATSRPDEAPASATDVAGGGN